MKPSKAQLKLLWKVSTRGNTSRPASPWTKYELSQVSRSLEVCVRHGWIERLEASKTHGEEYLRLTTKGQKVIRRYPDRRLPFQEYCQLIEDSMRRLGWMDENDAPLVTARHRGAPATGGATKPSNDKTDTAR